ncbi:MAG TPA: hypothetical protein VF175_15270 [Lacipirellula sp.]
MPYRFHCNVFARPSHASESGIIELRGLQLPTIVARAFDAFLPVTFEQAIESLSKLPRLDAEPDGFFVIAGDADGRRWQVDGHLFDFNDRLHRVELHGQCPPNAFDSLVQCFGWPGATLAFELVMEGVALEEAAFRQWAAMGTTNGANG